MQESNEWSKIFWDDAFEGSAKGGMHFRSMKLGKFIKDTEDKGYIIAGIKFDESNNCELLFAEQSDELNEAEQ
jgi:hypothetical protein